MSVLYRGSAVPKGKIKILIKGNFCSQTFMGLKWSWRCVGVWLLSYAHKLQEFALRTIIVFLHAYCVCCVNVHVTGLSEILKYKFKNKSHNSTTSRWHCCTEPTQIIANSDSKITPRAFPPNSGSFRGHNERTQNVRNINLLINPLALELDI